MPALFPGTNLAAVPKMHGNVCLSPAWALFPDRGYLKIDLANSNRQISDAPDGFRSIAGCNMRHCIAPANTPLRNMYCGHIVCERCCPGSDSAHCEKCWVQIEKQILAKAKQCQKSRKDKFLDYHEVHLTKCGSESEGNEDDLDGEGSDDNEPPASDSDDEQGHEDENGLGTVLTQQAKRSFVDSLKIEEKIANFVIRPVAVDAPAIVAPAAPEPQCQLVDAVVGTSVQVLTARNLTGIATFSPGKVLAICPSEGVLFHVQLDNEPLVTIITQVSQIKFGLPRARCMYMYRHPMMLLRKCLLTDPDQWKVFLRSLKKS